YNDKNRSYWAVTEAIKTKSLETLTWLLDYGYPFIQCSDDLLDPVALASHEDFIEALNLFLKRGYIRPKLDGEVILRIALSKDSAKLLGFLRNMTTGKIFSQIRLVALI